MSLPKRVVVGLIVAVVVALPRILVLPRILALPRALPTLPNVVPTPSAVVVVLVVNVVVVSRQTSSVLQIVSKQLDSKTWLLALDLADNGLLFDQAQRSHGLETTVAYLYSKYK